eukprot:1363666-Prymnesium_polylepis.1
MLWSQPWSIRTPLSYHMRAQQFHRPANSQTSIESSNSVVDRIREGTPSPRRSAGVRGDLRRSVEVRAGPRGGGRSAPRARRGPALGGP